MSSQSGMYDIGPTTLRNAVIGKASSERHAGMRCREYDLQRLDIKYMLISHLPFRVFAAEDLLSLAVCCAVAVFPLASDRW